MSTTCLSSATIVRCNALSRAETTGIFIPPVLQFIFSIVLVASRWGSGKRKHFLLAVEGFVYFILTLLDLLSHQLDSPRNSIQTFKIFDIVIGVLSFVPILLYTTFLYVLTRKSFIPFIPRRFQRVANYTLLGFIPVTLATNEVGSFVGISYLMLQDIFGNRVLAIGFRGQADQAVWQFFNSITLAMLLIFQAVVVVLSFYHFVKPYITRNFDRDGDSSLKPYLHKGVGWIALGVKLGAVETLVGFVDEHYDTVVARRVLRLLSRACMIIAVLTGLDGFEDFRSTQGTRKRKPTMTSTDIRGLISNPRNSTFMRLSPNATAFYNMPRAGNPNPNPDTIKSFASEEARKARQQHRVTVHVDNQGRKPPMLNLRLSDLNIPDPEVLTATYHKRGTLVGVGGLQYDEDGDEDEKSAMQRVRKAESVYSLAAPEEVATRTFKYSQGRGPVNLVRSKSAVSRTPSKGSSQMRERGLGLPASVRRNGSKGSILSRAMRHISAGSSGTDTVDTVHQFANQFPGIPPRVTRPTKARMSELGEGYEGTWMRASSGAMGRSGGVMNSNPFDDPSGGLSRQGSNGSGMKVGTGDKGKSTTSLVSTMGSVKRKAVPVPPPIDATLARPNMQIQVTDETTAANKSDRVSAGEHGRRGSEASELSTNTIETSLSNDHQERDPFSPGSDFGSTSTGLGTIAKRVAELERRRAALKQQKQPLVPTEVMADAEPIYGSPSSRNAEVSRIKSIGRVSSERTTPTPSVSEFMRQSLEIEQGQIALVGRGSGKSRMLRAPVERRY